MKVTVNGQQRAAPEEQTVAGLLREMKLDRAPCAVEVNRKVIPKSAHETTRLAEGDRLEIVTLVGGG